MRSPILRICDFINAHGGEDAVTEHYREQFTPRARQPKSETAVVVWAIYAETDAEANVLASSFKMLICVSSVANSSQCLLHRKCARFLVETRGAARLSAAHSVIERKQR